MQLFLIHFKKYKILGNMKSFIRRLLQSLKDDKVMLVEDEGKKNTI